LAVNDSIGLVIKPKPITRNIEDYKNAEIKVLLPEEFIGMFEYG